MKNYARKKVEYLSILGGCAVVGLALWFAVHLYFGELIKQQERRNTFLTEQITTLDKKIAEIKRLEKEKESLIARMNAIETLQTSRPVIVHLFDELVRTLPEGVHLGEVTQKGTTVTIKGIAQSNARVSNYMRNVESSQWLTAPKLSIIQTKTQQRRRISDFTLTMKQAKQKTKSEDEEDF